MTKRANNFLQEQVVFTYDHAQLTANTEVSLFKCSRKFRLDRVRYVNPTGLAADATDFFNLQLNNGTTLMANWSTEDGEEGALTADTFVDFTNAADANLVADAGDVLSIEFEEDGTATLPPGRLQIEGRYL